MCIRDRLTGDVGSPTTKRFIDGLKERLGRKELGDADKVWDCLLYTSDAADERSSVDLGGRRIIKKKKQ